MAPFRIAALGHLVQCSADDDDGDDDDGEDDDEDDDDDDDDDGDSSAVHWEVGRATRKTAPLPPRHHLLAHHHHHHRDHHYEYDCHDCISLIHSTVFCLVL